MLMKNHEIVDVYQLQDHEGYWYWACLRLTGLEEYPTFNDLCKRFQELGYEILSFSCSPFDPDEFLVDFYKLLVRY